MENKLYYVCKYTPLELLESYGFHVERLDPELESVECDDSLGHPNLCGYGKAILKAVEDGKINQLFLVNCCDVVKRVYDVLINKKDLDFLYLMDLPHKNSPLENKRMKKEILKLNDFLIQYTGRDFNEDKAGEYWQQRIKNFRSGRPEGEYIVLTGAHGNGSLKSQIERVTGIKVLDDTCNGNRELYYEGGEFFESYSKALLSQKSPCMRMQFNREDEIKGLGTICHTVKFCDYYGFQYRGLRDDESPLLKIETDLTAQSQGQIETRLEAFKEVINPNMIHIADSKKGKYVAGIDSGSSSTNAVILDESKNILGYSIILTGGGAEISGQKAFEEALKNSEVNREDIAKIITTGYGRKNINISDSSITEITCHAKGARYLYPEARTVIDIGGQDSKVIALDEEGNVINFVMNDKCAAGTGRFLETMAKTLGLTLDEMSVKGLGWKVPVTISNTCTVFAESEVVSLIAKNTDLADIINGLNQSIATKTVSLIKRAKGKPPYIMTGGVSNNVGVVKDLEKELGYEIYVSKEAQICGALGAALFALE